VRDERDEAHSKPETCFCDDRFAAAAYLVLLGTWRASYGHLNNICCDLGVLSGAEVFAEKIVERCCLISIYYLS